MIFINFLILKILERDESETTKVVNVSKANEQACPGKLIKFPKKIGKWTLKTQTQKGYKGIEWELYPKSNSKFKRYYYSPNLKKYNRTGFREAEIVLFAKPGYATVYMYYMKDTNRVYFGITKDSITFQPKKCLSIFTRQIKSLEEAPLAIQLDWVNGKKNLEKIKKDHQASPIATVIYHFPPRIFSEYIDYNEIPCGPLLTPYDPGYDPDENKNETKKFDIMLPMTGLNRRQLIKKWLQYKIAVPKEATAEEIEDNSTIIAKGAIHTSKGKEPEDVTIDRHKRDKKIEKYLDILYEEDNIALDTLPEADERGYVHGRDWSDKYNIDNPDSLFKQLSIHDKGYPTYIYLNGDKLVLRWPLEQEIKVDPGQFAFYYCPTDETFGIRYKKHYIRDSEGNGKGNEGNSKKKGKERDKEDQPAPIISKYIYLQALGVEGGDINAIDYVGMKPTTVDFYTNSYFYLGRMNYTYQNMKYKDQVAIKYSDLYSKFKNQFNNIASTSNTH